MKTIQEQFADAVKAQIGGNKDHGWGVEDSMAVIDVLIAENCERIAADKGLPEDVAGFIKAVINPSAFRQRLESKKMLNERESKGKRVDNLFAGF